MSEEVKEEQNVEETQDAAAPAEETAGEQQSADASSPAKAKKINRLSLDQLNAKIKDMDEKKLEDSKYYKHLMERKRELEGPQE